MKELASSETVYVGHPKKLMGGELRPKPRTP